MDIFSLFSKDSPRNARTIKDVKTYLSQRYDLLKLELLEKSSQLLSVILSMLIVVVCALAVLIYLSSALISWLTLALNAGWAYTIVCALFVVIILVVLHYKDMLFVKPLIRKFSRILYGRSEKETSEPEETQTPVEVIFDKEGDDHD
jgi:hypothetical protein